ncbi:chaperonin 10-like protein [Leptodontidium sp. 2 PMI_412]|nr:chaperonin 10-like protein [Leptodontidium sp. 2 PMI_412]
MSITYTVFKGTPEGKIIEAKNTREILPNEVLVKVTHSGICGTDQHYKTSGMALGHEGAGIVEKLGASVTDFAKGDSVGWGYTHYTCGQCKQCLSGHDSRCQARGQYGFANFDQGSFASHGIWRADALFKIPPTMPREYAAPLMCGGATVHAALTQFDVKPTDRVGIIGVGGLGHLAIQFAAKMGCDVVAFSSTNSKEKEALSLGAGAFFPTKDQTEIAVGEKLDHLIVTTSAQPNWGLFLPLLAPGATVFPLTVDMGELRIPYMALLGSQIRIQGTTVADRQVHREMIAFADRHKIFPVIEKFEMSVDGITNAMQKLSDGKMRYRGVLETKGVEVLPVR